MLCAAVCSPYRLKLHGWSPPAWQRSYGLNTPRTSAARRCFARCPQTFINSPGQPLASAALPVALSLAVTLALWPEQSTLRLLTGLRSSERCSLAGAGKVWPCPCPACLRPGVLQGLACESGLTSACAGGLCRTCLLRQLLPQKAEGGRPCLRQISG